MANPATVVGIGGRVWFTSCCILAAIVLSAHWVNPDRDPDAQDPKESNMIVFLNILVLFAVIPWFWSG